MHKDPPLLLLLLHPLLPPWALTLLQHAEPAVRAELGGLAAGGWGAAAAAVPDLLVAAVAAGLLARAAGAGRHYHRRHHRRHRCHHRGRSQPWMMPSRAMAAGQPWRWLLQGWPDQQCLGRWQWLLLLAPQQWPAAAQHRLLELLMLLEPRHQQWPAWLEKLGHHLLKERPRCSSALPPLPPSPPTTSFCFFPFPSARAARAAGLHSDRRRLVSRFRRGEGSDSCSASCQSTPARARQRMHICV